MEPGENGLKVGARLRMLAAWGEWREVVSLSDSFVQVQGGHPMSRRVMENLIATGRVEVEHEPGKLAGTSSGGFDFVDYTRDAGSQSWTDAFGDAPREALG